jgi:P4 family phage/plasmid primase-like protien
MATRPKRTTGAIRAAAAPTPPTAERVAQWHAVLLADDERRTWLRDERGLKRATLVAAQIGWNRGRYTIPVLDAEGQLVNVRRYDPNAEPGKKMRNTTGCGSPPRWFPLPALLDADPSALVVVCEGEWDALLAQQRFDAEGIAAVAVTGTGGAGSPPAEVEPFRDRSVAVVYDCDDAGRNGARKLAERLLGVAKCVRVVDLGLGDDGQDVTDWFANEEDSANERSAAELVALIDSTAEYEPGGSRRSTVDLLRVAVEEKCKAAGSRNAAGFWLACQLRDERYTYAEAEPVMRAFAEAVTGTKPVPYPVSEALASLESAYSRPARDPNGNREAGRDYGWDDIGNAQRLADRHGPDMRFIAAYGGWHIWDGRRWVYDESGETMRWAKETARAVRAEALRLRERDPELGGRMLGFANTSASAGKLRAALDLAKSEPGLSARASDFDRDRRLFVVRNGTLVLGDNRASFREHRREDCARLAAPVAFEPDADTSRWLALVEAWLPDAEVRDFVHKLVGYTLQGGNPERLLPVLLGPSSTGKTTFLEVLRRVLGEYAASFDLSMFRAKQDESPRADLVHVIARRLVFTSEASAEWHLHGDVLKRLTGNDTIKARRPHSADYVERVPDFTPWIAANSPPQVHGVDQALYRRLVTIPFQAVVDTSAARLDLAAAVAREDGAAVLRWAVEGWNRYRADGVGDYPAAVVEATLAMREELSHLDAWLAEECERDAAFCDAASSLYLSYTAWCVESGIRDRERLSSNAFGRELSGRGFPLGRSGSGSSGNQRRVRLGLRVRPQVIDVGRAET